MMNKYFELRELQLSDAASLAENANNINIWNNVRDALPYPYSEEDGKQFIETKLEKTKTTVDFAIVVEGKVIGGISIIPQNDVERVSAEIGYWIGEKYWNKGIMSSAIKQMVTYAFTNLPQLRKIFAKPFDYNIASQKVLQKAGFELEAILKQAAIKNEKIIDIHYYSLLKSQWLKSIEYRSLTKDDLPVLKDLLYEAIFLPEGVEPLPRDVIEKPEIDIYIRDFGSKKDDFCLLATLDGKIIGGAWVRILADEIKGYGNIDPETPEFAVSLFREYRNQGIETKLMVEMIDYLKNKGYKQCSLAVQKANYAVRMYQNIGFEIVKEKEEEYLMVLKLR
jgi:RimJ/RimL family protein N-acetyltransferase